ncbi:MAG TPA: Ldh family oxidoreductase [Candidatus Binatia bacterium]|nr:Ldh family oxidoreductase [Candidatus Binatia bacterium]
MQGREEESIHTTADELRELTTRVFEAAGAPTETARQVADHLVEANLAGHDSHGVLRVADYVRHVRDGQIRPAAEPGVTQSTPVAALVDGGWGFGQPAANVAIDRACDAASASGVGLAAVVRAYHLGRLGAYMERAAARGFVALAWLGGFGTERGAVPYGGARAAFGTNPLAAAFPTTAAGEQVLVDLATTGAAAGKIMVLADKGEPAPEGWLVDREGRPTTDPRDFANGGALLPAGRHKGYGLAVLAELLGQTLTGADETGEEGGGGGVYRRAGSLFLALDPGLFRAAETTRAVAAEFADGVRAIPPAPGFERVLIPGDPERLNRRRLLQEGIALPAATWRGFRAAAESVGVHVEP